MCAPQKAEPETDSGGRVHCVSDVSPCSPALPSSVGFVIAGWMFLSFWVLCLYYSLVLRMGITVAKPCSNLWSLWSCCLCFRAIHICCAWAGWPWLSTNPVTSNWKWLCSWILWAFCVPKLIWKVVSVITSLFLLWEPNICEASGEHYHSRKDLCHMHSLDLLSKERVVIL